MRVVPFLLLLAVLAAGCASTDGAADAVEGAKRAYRDSRQAVFDAALAVAKKQRLEVVESDAAGGRLLLSSRATVSNWGERITVLVRPLADGFTEVEIVNTSVFEFMAFSPHWDQVLFAQLDEALRKPDPE